MSPGLLSRLMPAVSVAACDVLEVCDESVRSDVPAGVRDVSVRSVPDVGPVE